MIKCEIGINGVLLEVQSLLCDGWWCLSFQNRRSRTCVRYESPHVSTRKSWSSCQAALKPSPRVLRRMWGSKGASCSVTSESLWPCGPQPTSFLCPWDSPGKNTGVACHSPLQGSFPTQGSNLCVLHCRRILYCLSHQRNPHSERCSPHRKNQGKCFWKPYFCYRLGTGLWLTSSSSSVMSPQSSLATNRDPRRRLSPTWPWPTSWFFSPLGFPTWWQLLCQGSPCPVLGVSLCITYRGWLAAPPCAPPASWAPISPSLSPPGQRRGWCSEEEPPGSLVLPVGSAGCSVYSWISGFLWASLVHRMSTTILMPKASGSAHPRLLKQAVSTCGPPRMPCFLPSWSGPVAPWCFSCSDTTRGCSIFTPPLGTTDAPQRPEPSTPSWCWWSPSSPSTS